MEDISLHILDIVENSIAAGAKNVFLKIREDKEGDILAIEIKDDGEGMDEELMRKATDPFVTTKEVKKVGLGLALLKEAAQAANGWISVKSRKGSGTIVKAQFQLSHVDRKPLGNLRETIFCIMATFHGIDFTYEHQKDEKICRINAGDLRKMAGEAFLSSPDWIRFLKENIKKCFDKMDLNTSP